MKQPKAPDPKRIANEQTRSNIATAVAQARLGMANQVTPFGSVTYTENAPPAASLSAPPAAAPQPQIVGYRTVYAGGNDDDNMVGGASRREPIYGEIAAPANGVSQNSGNYVPQFTATQSFSPEVQRVFDALYGQSGQPLSFSGPGLTGFDSGSLPAMTGLDMSGAPGMRGYDFSALPELQDIGGVPGIQAGIGPDDFSADRQKVEDAMFARLNPQIERDRAAMETRLFNQGVMPGTEAYREAMAQLERSIADQRTSITLAGGQEQSRLFDMAVQKGVFANQAQAQAFDQQLARAGLSMQQRQQIMSEQTADVNLSMAQRQQLLDEQLAAAGVSQQQRQQLVSEMIGEAGVNLANRQQTVAEQMAERQTPMQELAALLGIGQMPAIQVPQPGVGGVDVAGLYQNQYNAQAANYQSKMGGIFGLAGSVLGGPVGGAIGGALGSIFGR